MGDIVATEPSSCALRHDNRTRTSLVRGTAISGLAGGLTRVLIRRLTVSSLTECDLRGAAAASSAAWTFTARVAERPTCAPLVCIGCGREQGIVHANYFRLRATCTTWWCRHTDPVGTATTGLGWHFLRGSSTRSTAIAAPASYAVPALQVQRARRTGRPRVRDSRCADGSSGGTRRSWAPAGRRSPRRSAGTGAADRRRVAEVIRRADTMSVKVVTAHIANAVERMASQ